MNNGFYFRHYIGGGHSNPDCSTAECNCKNISTLSVSIWTAAQIGDETTVRQRGEKNSQLLSKLDYYGYSPLHYAAQNGHETIVRYLLFHKVPVDGESCGATALHRAVVGGSLACVKLLVKSGANINAIDRSFGDGNTPAHKALLYHQQHILDYLVRHGADVNIPNTEGFSVQKLMDDPTLIGNLIAEPVSTITDYSCQPCSTPPPIKDTAPSLLPRCSKCFEESLSFKKNRAGKLLCQKCYRS